MKKSAFSILLLLGCALSCVYPYDADVAGDSGNLVVEGDIFIGSESEFALSTLEPISGSYTSTTLYGKVYVEDENGAKYNGEYSKGSRGESVFVCDTRSADPSLRHRLRIELNDGRNYSSEWASSGGTCVLDSLSYRIVGDKEALEMLVSLHTDGSSSNFRYRYTETWEYTAQAYAYYYYDPEQTDEHPFGQVLRYPAGENTYYCWDSDKSRGINLASTESMSEDVLVNYPIISFERDDTKISYVYRLDLDVYPVNADSYAFYEHLKNMSELSGDLFSPMPSEMRGNINSDSDPDEMVYGYVAVVTPSHSRLYVENGETNFYKAKGISRVDLIDDQGEDTWPTFYRKGYLPVMYNMESKNWADKKCVDCRYQGGTKTRPDEWINDHK